MPKAHGFAKITLPLPKTTDQITLRGELAGIPSSVAVAFSVTATIGIRVVWSGPALHTGALLPGLTVS